MSLVTSVRKPDHRPMTRTHPAVQSLPVNIDEVLSQFEERWSPRVLASVNDYAVKLVKVEGDFVWHSHPETDELFIVLSGDLDIRLRTEADGEWVVHLERGDAYVVPIGVEHRPGSATGADLLLLEPASTFNTGDYEGDVPEHIDKTRGHEVV